MGFLVICSGVVLLQLAKSSKDVPDAAVFKGELDQVRTVVEQEEPEYEPRADTIRGGAAIVRAMSRVRTKRQADEVRRIHDERMKPIGESEEFEWDGLRRRRTTSTSHTTSVKRSKTVHPPLGMSSFPNEDEVSDPEDEVHPGFFGRIGRKSHTTFGSQAKKHRTGRSPVPLGSVRAADVEAGEAGAGEHAFGLPPSLQKPHEQHEEDTAYRGPGGQPSTHIHFAGEVHDRDRASSGGSSLAPPRPPPHAAGATTTAGGAAKRQFSFQNVFHRKRSDGATPPVDDARPTSRGALSFISGHSREYHPYPGTSGGDATEEERLGLVHGDSSTPLPTYSEEAAEAERDSDEWQVTSASHASSSPYDVGGDLGRPRGGDQGPYDGYGDVADDDDDELYDEPLQSPTRDYGYHGGSGHSGGSGSGRFV